MGRFWTSTFIALSLTTIANKIKLGDTAAARKTGSKDDFVRVQVPAYVQEGDTAFLKCLYDVDTDKMYSMKWYKGAQEFFRFTPKESPSVKSFPAFGGQVDLSLSNFSDVALVNLDLNMTDKYTCEVTKDFPDYTTSMKTGKMTVIALPEYKPQIAILEKRSFSVGDIFSANCTSFRSKPVASITWLLNGFPVGPHYLTTPVITRDEDNKETITAGLNFTVRQQDFIRNRMTLTCQAKLEPDLYTSTVDVTILEHDRPKISSVVDNYSSLLPSAGAENSKNPSISSSGSVRENIPIKEMTALLFVLRKVIVASLSSSQGTGESLNSLCSV